ncbi:MAG: M20/M25/M40 family metallo-hydrolase [Saprospiraceae bacterium]|nr:M20/M25/M40 family metallo-hydrolase [Saprospiraceae bacterium]
MHRFIFFLFLTGFCTPIFGQNANSDDAFFIREIYDEALTDGRSYPWLEFLATRIGGRLAGSPQAAAAVEYTKQMLDTLHLDSVWLQPCMVPHWVRGEKEQVKIISSRKMGDVNLRAFALGNSVGTGESGIAAEVVEVQSLDEVDKLGPQALTGKIVFYNRPMDPTQINTFNAYGGAVDQRGAGASRASKQGAIGVLVRSMTTRNDDFPHTGGMSYEAGVTPVPALAISTNDANLLSELLKEESVRVFIKCNPQKYPDKLSYNVIGEIRGSEKPEEIILVGGHLDSWDVGQGAHDDGAGCVQSMDVLQLFKRLNYKPKRTIRCVLFMNEENGLAGGRAYAEISNKNKEFHLAAIESDRGGFTPRGFTAESQATDFEKKFKNMSNWLPLLEPYGLTLSLGGGGADIGPLRSQKGLLIGLYPDSQRYFDYHHTAIDTFDAVNKRELELGAAAMTALVYLLDKYGTE